MAGACAGLFVLSRTAVLPKIQAFPAQRAIFLRIDQPSIRKRDVAKPLSRTAGAARAAGVGGGVFQVADTLLRPRLRRGRPAPRRPRARSAAATPPGCSPRPRWS